MGAVKNLTKGTRGPMSSGTIIRRVVHVRDKYICGICRSDHATPGEANGCLTACWNEVLAGPLTCWKRRGVITKAQCKLCKRDHNSMPEAKNCAEECKNRLGITLYSIDGGAPKTAFVRRRRPVMAVQPAYRKKDIDILLDETPQEQSGAQKANTVVGSAPVIQAQGPSEEALAEPPPGDPAPEKAAKKPRDNTKKFFRDGARYVCADCQAKYFTKSEVEKCWDSH